MAAVRDFQPTPEIIHTTTTVLNFLMSLDDKTPADGDNDYLGKLDGDFGRIFGEDGGLPRETTLRFLGNCAVFFNDLGPQETVIMPLELLATTRKAIDAVACSDNAKPPYDDLMERLGGSKATSERLRAAFWYFDDVLGADSDC